MSAASKNTRGATKAPTAAAWARQIRAAVHGGGSPAVATSSQRFFTEPVASQGWRTADLRRFARKLRNEILRESGPEVLLEVADRLFDGKFNDVTHVGVMLLQDRVGGFGDDEFRRFEGWLARVTNWSQHDALVHYLVGPMMVADAKRTARVRAWARSSRRWRRRAAAVALVQAARRKLYFPRVAEVTQALLSDPDDMVQKGLGWLLREWSKADPRRTVPFLLRIRDSAPRLVLRTACETLPARERARVLLRAAGRREGVIK